jgi:hypothetical protein
VIGQVVCEVFGQVAGVVFDAVDEGEFAPSQDG